MVKYRLFAGRILTFESEIETTVPKELAQGHVLHRVVAYALDLGRTALDLTKHPYRCDENALVIKGGDISRKRPLRGIILSTVPWSDPAPVRRLAIVNAKGGAAAQLG